MKSLLLTRIISVLGIVAILSGFLIHVVGQVYASSIFSYLVGLMYMVSFLGSFAAYLFMCVAVIVGWLLIVAFYLLVFLTLVLSGFACFIKKPGMIFLSAISGAYFCLGATIFVGLCLATANKMFVPAGRADQIPINPLYFLLPILFVTIAGYFILLIGGCTHPKEVQKFL